MDWFGKNLELNFWLSSDDAHGFYKSDFSYKGVRVRVRVRVSTNPTLTLTL